MAQTQKCERCGKNLSADRLAKHKKTCFLCEKAITREKAEAAHDKRVCANYGLRPGEYKKLYEAQGGKCAVRGCPARGLTLRLAVDHDHDKGLHNRNAIRGLLCKRHNRMILPGDTPEVFDSMAEYLRHPPAWKVLGTNGYAENTTARAN